MCDGVGGDNQIKKKTKTKKKWCKQTLKWIKNEKLFLHRHTHRHTDTISQSMWNVHIKEEQKKKEIENDVPNSEYYAKTT